MKLTKTELKQIIKEELEKIMSEAGVVSQHVEKGQATAPLAQRQRAKDRAEKCAELKKKLASVPVAHDLGQDDWAYRQREMQIKDKMKELGCPE